MDANTVFNQMILTTIVASIVVFAVFLITAQRRMSKARDHSCGEHRGPLPC